MTRTTAGKECTEANRLNALICSNVKLISQLDGQADGICYSSVILLSVMQQLLVLCWR